jgi:hypothetical protein
MIPPFLDSSTKYDWLATWYEGKEKKTAKLVGLTQLQAFCLFFNNSRGADKKEGYSLQIIEDSDEQA